MPGGQYIALSGMRTRLDQLERISTDLSNADTIGYKAERSSDLHADRPSFDAALQTAIDVTEGARRLDLTAGSIDPTGRDLDVAIEGEGFFTIETPNGPRYTRNGHFKKSLEGVLVTPDGSVVQGVDGPLNIGAGSTGKIQIESDGTVKSGARVVGQIAVVKFDDTRQLVRETGASLRADGATPVPIEEPVVQAGALEQSNVSVVERIAELTNMARNFEALQKAVSMMMNDVYGQAIQQLGRR